MAEELLSGTNATLSKEGSSTATTNGSCLCGAITYTIKGSPSTTVLCHCTSCKKQSGSSFKANSIYHASVPLLPLSYPPFLLSIGPRVLLDHCANNNSHLQQFAITSLNPTALKVYNDPSPDAGDVVVERYFCRECGSNMYIRNPKFADAVIVASGTVDGDELGREWRPEKEYYCKRKGKWLDEKASGADGTKTFEGMT